MPHTPTEDTPLINPFSTLQLSKELQTLFKIIMEQLVRGCSPAYPYENSAIWDDIKDKLSELDQDTLENMIRQLDQEEKEGALLSHVKAWTKLEIAYMTSDTRYEINLRRFTAADLISLENSADLRVLRHLSLVGMAPAAMFTFLFAVLSFDNGEYKAHGAYKTHALVSSIFLAFFLLLHIGAHAAMYARNIRAGKALDNYTSGIASGVSFFEVNSKKDDGTARLKQFLSFLNSNSDPIRFIKKLVGDANSERVIASGVTHASVPVDDDDDDVLNDDNHMLSPV